MTAPYWSNGVATLYQADARAIPLPDGSVHCVVTSPPYWGLRDYGLADWDGGDPECGHERHNPNAQAYNYHGHVSGKQWTQDGNAWPNGICGHCGAIQQAAGIGLEPTLADWLANIVAVSLEVWRVLRDDGTYWLNLGDSYSTGASGNQSDKAGAGNVNPNQGSRRTKPARELPPKNLMGQPWRVAFALQDDGWILRSAIVWHKPNPMPESVSDRPTSAYEMVFLLTKRAHYFYDVEAIREPQSPDSANRLGLRPANPKDIQGDTRNNATGLAKKDRPWEYWRPQRPQRLADTHPGPARGPLCHVPRRAAPPLHTGRHQRSRRMRRLRRAVG